MKQKITVIYILFFLAAIAIPGRAAQEKEITGPFALLEELAYRSKENKTGMCDIQKFLAISTKFADRDSVMTDDVLSTLYRNYENYNVLVDFVEKIPIRKPETVTRLFQWVKNFERLHPRNKALLTSIFQSVFEIFSHAAKYAPDRYDYDVLLEKLMAIPWDSGHFYDKLFEFLHVELKIKKNRKDLIFFLLEGLPNRDITIDNTRFTFMVNDDYRGKIEEILRSQEICPLFTLLEINRLFDLLIETESLSAANRTAGRIAELCQGLPYADISNEAPKEVRNRVVIYSREKMDSDLALLIEKVNSDTAKPNLRALILKIKNNYLVHQLKDHLLGLAYAVNAKYPKLRVFLNPNMVRLHNFNDAGERTAWNYSGTPSAAAHFSGYHFSGGLSRLNILFAGKWYQQLFRRSFIYDAAHVQSFLVNLLDLYPVPPGEEDIAANTLMVDLGIDLLQDARDNDTKRKDVVEALAAITSGYHYRKAVNYVNRKYKDHDLFFSELKQLGEIFFDKGKYLDNPALKKLPKHRRPAPGGIYYHTFGNLTPQSFRLFPQDMANLFDSGRVGGELVDEFRIKTGWHLYKNKIPPALLGQVLYAYTTRTAPRVFSQNYTGDYFATYFVFKVFNNSHLRKILKDLRKEGCLKLK